MLAAGNFAFAMPVISKPSPALLAANERLLALRAHAQVRARVQADRPAAVVPAEPVRDAAEAPVCLTGATGRVSSVTDGVTGRVGEETGCPETAETAVTGSATALDCSAGARTDDTALPWVDAVTEPPSSDDFLASLPLTLPRHLGWGSEPLTRALRQAQARQQADQAVASGAASETTGAAGNDAGCGDYNRKPANGHFDQLGAWTAQAAPGNGLSTASATSSAPAASGVQGSSAAADPAPVTSSAQTVKLYPDIGLAMLREEQTAAGRLWLLLRALDEEGRGWLRVANVRPLLTKKSSKTYLCGWRQLRNLLRDGDDLYWQRDEERIWLRSAAKVAFGLGVERLTGRPVALPLEALLNGIGRFRAELYAAFHSGRVKTAPDGQEQVAPIARETLTTLSGVGETTQRRYEAQLSEVETAVEVQPNYAIGNKASESELEEKGWTQGQALFVLEDFHGRQGPKGEQYVAWQLPNSYTGSHQHRPKGRQRRINRQLKDLVMKGMPGNRGQTGEATQADSKRVDSGSECADRVKKLYYPNGKLAAQAFNRRKVDSCYWRQKVGGNGRFGAFSADHTGTGNARRYGLWQHLELCGGASQR
jgi:hypothetical protein